MEERFNMESENKGQNRDDANINVKRLIKEPLEISSTGYGFESVSKETEENTLLETKNSNTSCGGL
jgi:hypothetical protein